MSLGASPLGSEPLGATGGSAVTVVVAPLGSVVCGATVPAVHSVQSGGIAIPAEIIYLRKVAPQVGVGIHVAGPSPASVVVAGQVPAVYQLVVEQVPAASVVVGPSSGPTLSILCAVPAATVETGAAAGSLSVLLPIPTATVGVVGFSGIVVDPVPAGAIQCVGQAPQIGGAVVVPSAQIDVAAFAPSQRILIGVPAGQVHVVGRIGWVVEAKTTGRTATFHGAGLAISEYTLPVLDVAVVDGEVQFLTTTAVVKLSGTIEAGAAPKIQTGKMNLTPGKDCVVHPFRALLAATDALDLVVEADRDGMAQTTTYVVPAARSTQERERVVPLGKGAYGSGWSFTLKSLVGRAAPWSVSAASVEILNTKRRL